MATVSTYSSDLDMTNAKPNIDENELNKFSSLSAQWWDPNAKLKTLHQVNPLRISFIKEKIRVWEHKKLIDVGCGGGILTDALSQAGMSATGIDMNPSLIEVAKLHQLESGQSAEYLTTTAEDIADERANSYDVVSCFELLEHVPNPYSIIKACEKLAKPGGHLFFSTLNRNPKSYLFAILGAEYFLKLLPKHTHDYRKFIKPSELHQWVIEANMLPKSIRGITYHPLTKQFSLSNDVSINYILHVIKPEKL